MSWQRLGDVVTEEPWRTPDQLALVMGRHKNKVKKQPGGAHDKPLLQKEGVPGETDDRLAKEYGVSPVTIWRAGKFAAAVETLGARVLPFRRRAA